MLLFTCGVSVSLPEYRTEFLRRVVRVVDADFLAHIFPLIFVPEPANPKKREKYRVFRRICQI